MWLALLLAVDSAVALRHDRSAVTQAQAAAMTPAVLADALLAPGHPPIGERVMLPDGMGPPSPVGFIPPLDVQLYEAPAFDGASGFCVRHSWRVTGDAAGHAERIAATPTRYRLPSSPGACAAPWYGYFTVLPQDRSRAFTIIRLLAAASRDAARVPFPLAVDDQEGRERTRYCTEHPNGCSDHPSIITDPCAALAGLPLRNIGAIGRTTLAGADLLTSAELTAPDGRRRED